ncbi:hypothetical protein [Bremerella sp. P1]|uniref:hypothetical protein n=1 Tax=Bremerella sp. P1 TaxID=3026424 RepID=UPI0023683407|nr:hypothetical protein [Bremerella sp. P1]WDI43965.1 hypothetical protein PSR63_08455 [Bremerella sp. P1]
MTFGVICRCKLFGFFLLTLESRWGWQVPNCGNLLLVLLMGVNLFHQEVIFGALLLIAEKLLSICHVGILTYLALDVSFVTSPISWAGLDVVDEGTESCLTAQSSRRWSISYSLFALMFIVLVLGFCCGWLALAMRQADQNRRANARVEEQNVAIGKLDFLVLTRTARKPSMLGRWIGDPGRKEIHWVQAAERPLDDATITELVTLLLDVPSVEKLDLRFTAVSDRGLKRVGELDHLKELFLGYEQTPTGAKNASQGITDVGIRHLTRLKNLEFLSVQNTNVTEEGLREFAEAIPDCRIVTHLGLLR